MDQRIRFCTSSDGVRIAYRVTGHGPLLIKAANWLSHLEFDQQSPVWRHWLRELARHYSFVSYDQRGCGLSDWDVEDLSIDARVRDLEAVVDALDLERFSILGISQGGATSVAYAARHPERVSRLVLYGAYARGRGKRGLSREERAEAETLLRLTPLASGKDNPAYRQVFTTLFVPDATAEQVRWFNELQRMSASPENATRIRVTSNDIDISDLAPTVQASTLVLHVREDAMIPFEEGRRLAALIPNARFVPLEGRNHILLEDEPAWPRFVEELHSFLRADCLSRPAARTSFPNSPRASSKSWSSSPEGSPTMKSPGISLSAPGPYATISPASSASWT